MSVSPCSSFFRQRSRAGRFVVAPDNPSSLKNGLASGLLQCRELQGGVLVVGRYAGMAVFHRPILNLTFDTRQVPDWRFCQ
jgi:hypothetical protein